MSERVFTWRSYGGAISVFGPFFYILCGCWRAEPIEDAGQIQIFFHRNARIPFLLWICGFWHFS